MIVYVETNFVLELVRLQEEATACETLVEFCREGLVRLVIPAFSFVEPYGTLNRSDIKRNELSKAISIEYRQLIRTQSYKDQLGAMDEVSALLIRSIADESSRFDSTLAELLDLAETIPLEPKILASAVDYRKQYDFKRPEDAIVFSSVVSHLETQSPGVSCFLQKDADDFKNPDIKTMLDDFKCKLIFSFSDGVKYIKSRKPATDDT